MTKEQINIEIAKMCGWMVVNAHAGAVQWVGRWVQGNINPVETGNKVPKYSESLDAMHTAAATLDEFQRARFECLLVEIVSNGGFSMEKHPIASMHYVDALKGIHATAPQRAEAFLRTVGKWRDA